MPPDALPWLVVALVGVAFLVAGGAIIATSGAQLRMARRLGGAPQVKVGELFDAADPPARPVRVLGRVRCADPLVSAEDERLVAWHRDVEVRTRTGWRSIERRRETRSFELWDHDGALTVDPARAAEPLIAIPHVWHGRADELDETYQPAIARLNAQSGPVTEARAETRMISIIDRLLVLAEANRAGDRLQLQPPPGGYLLSALELDEAMRLLGGRRRRWLPIAVATTALGVVLALIGVTGLLVANLS